jgi:hypothetical protein
MVCQDKMLDMARLYMRVRIHHACKVSNLEGKNKGKQNRKDLKLANM